MFVSCVLFLSTFSDTAGLGHAFNPSALTLLRRAARSKRSVGETRQGPLPSRTSPCTFFHHLPKFLPPTHPPPPPPGRRNSSSFSPPPRSPPAAGHPTPSFVFRYFPHLPPRNGCVPVPPHPLGSPFRSACRRSHRLHTNVGPQRQRGGRSSRTRTRPRNPAPGAPAGALPFARCPLGKIESGGDAGTGTIDVPGFSPRRGTRVPGGG